MELCAGIEWWREENNADAKAKVFKLYLEGNEEPLKRAICDHKNATIGVVIMKNYRGTEEDNRWKR